MGEIKKWTKFITSSFVAFAFQSGLEYRNSDFKSFSVDDLAKSCKNLVNFGPATPEFMRAKMYTPRGSAVWLRPLGGATARPCRNRY